MRHPSDDRARMGDDRHMSRPDDTNRSAGLSADRKTEIKRLAERLIEVGNVDTHGEQVVFYGALRPGAAADFERLAAAERERGVDLWLFEVDRDRVALAAKPTVLERTSDPNPLWNVLLLGATLLTTVWAGALHQGVDLLADPARWPVGVPYAAALLAILGVHEMGHYLVARRRGILVTPPYFIPAPYFLGTFGAFIRMRGPIRDRKAYFDVAIAGPLAGLVVAVAAVLVGVAFEPAEGAHGALPAGSLLFAALYQVAGGGPLMTPVELGPIGFAGWLGLLVTALNLVPVGQLDGGHVAYAVLGRRRARLVALAMVALMVLAGLLISSHWLMWAVLVWALVGVEHPPAKNDLTPLGPGRTMLGLLALALFLSIVLPWPA